MGDWLDGFDGRPLPGHGGGSFTGGPPRLVLHTTEGGSVAGAISAYKAKGVPPHFTVDPSTGERCQHIPISRSAYAMKNAPGGVETNRRHAIQVEIVGFAAHTQDMSNLSTVWLGMKVLRPICEAVGIGYEHPEFVGTEHGMIATAHAAQRMSAAEWDAFAGICGHQHVPENDHWDPGRLRIDAAVAFARAQPNLPAVEAPRPPTDPSVAQLRRLAAGTYLPSVGDLPTPMHPSSGAPALAVIWLQRVLNLIFPTAALPEDGHYSQDVANVVAVFQALVNKLQPGTISDFPGAVGPATKFMLGVALSNIQKGTA